jgi:hypothetical protein
MELPEIVHKSDCIVEVFVESVESRWDADQKLAFTYITLRIDEEFKAAPLRTVTFWTSRRPGFRSGLGARDSKQPNGANSRSAFGRRRRCDIRLRDR